MKVAVCFSGHLRTIKDCYESHYENLLSVFNPDVFFHTWDSIESKTKSWHTNHMANKDVEESLVSFVEQKYSPTLMVVEETIDFGLQGNQVGTSIELNGLKSMTHSIKKSYELAKNHKDYDYIIKIRPDIFLANKFLQLPSDTGLLMYGNKKPSPVMYKGQDVNYGALDCMFVRNEKSQDANPFLIHDKFEEFYCKNKFFHSPFVDHLVFNKASFKINHMVIYGKNWIIKRG